MTKILMYGCGGHMGHVICDLIKDMDNVEVAAGVDVQAGEQREFPVFASLDEVNVEVDAIIDFSAAPAVDAVLAYAADRQIPLVECTTGLSEEQLADVWLAAGESEKAAGLYGQIVSRLKEDAPYQKKWIEKIQETSSYCNSIAE